MPKALVAAVVVFGFVLAPIVTWEIVGRDPAKTIAEIEQAKEAWRDYRDEIKLAERGGMAGSAGGRRQREAAQFDSDLEAAAASSPPAVPPGYQWNPAVAAQQTTKAPKRNASKRNAQPEPDWPRLEVSRKDRCRQAQFGSIFYLGGPLATYESEEAMRSDCKEFFPQPKEAWKPGDPELLEPSFDCHVVGGYWCPQSAPWFNPCEPGCFPSMDFRGASPVGQHCLSGFDCNASWAPR